jgi:catechol 2,3-dioxygenase-like lactoylglutathione lyase family enzyme
MLLMTNARLEHVNVTVADSRRTGDLLARLFGWRVRWQGPGKSGGYTVHVGTDDGYVALWSPAAAMAHAPETRLNHIAIEVPDLDAAEQRVIGEGYRPYNHGDYEPGRRFYFDHEDGIEFEVVSYA